ncbi:MAG: tetratricopeptide repeat protein [Gemmatimonadetes bacterium]|nr:tetratricopeptide repeat protein [Gemmatimonadota bacterium]
MKLDPRLGVLIRLLSRVGAVAFIGMVVAGTGHPVTLLAQDPCPSASSADAEAGWVAYSQGDLTEARTRFEAALDRCENDQYARTGLGYVALRQGDTPGGMRLFDVVVRAEPNNVDALVGLGLVSWRNGDLAAVRSRFNEVLQYAPDHPTALEYLGRLPGAEVGDQDEAEQAWLAGDTDEARSLYDERLGNDPDDRMALLRRGLMHGWDAEYGRALELLDRLVALDAGNLEARLARARVLAWSGRLREATTAVEGVLSIEPGHADALATLAVFYSWAGRSDEALASYDELLAIAPEHSTARRDRARALAWAQRYEQSIDVYLELVRQSPDDVEARLGLARARGFSGDFDGAVEEYARALELGPGDVRALSGRARTLGWAGRFVEAERSARRAVEANADSGVAWGVLGEVYRWQGRGGAAIEAFRRASSLAPNDASIRDQLRTAELAAAPRVRPSVRGEDDSDGNRMVTTSLVGRFHPMPRLEVHAEAYQRDLRQDLTLGTLDRTARGVLATGTYELDPGWMLTAGVGGSVSDGFGDPAFLAYRASARSPQRHRLDVTAELSSRGLDDTAALTDRGVRATQFLVTGRWRPNLDWRVDGQVGIGSYSGTESNGRRSFLVSATRGVGQAFSLGASFRGFSFEKNLFDGYFDPDFYGIAEVAGTWLHQPAPWTFLVELAPGVEQVTTDGDPTFAMRGNGRVGRRLAAVSEVSLAVSYSTASLTSFSAGGDGYDYLAVVFGVSWMF